MFKKSGREPQLGGSKGLLSVAQAGMLASQTLLDSAKKMTVVAYADSLTLAGQNYARGLGMNINYRDWENSRSAIYSIRILHWSGTPYLTLNDFVECAQFVDQYNEFVTEHVVNIFRQMEQGFPKHTFTYRLARESSVAIYMLMEPSWPKLPDEDVNTLRESLIADEGDWALTDGYRFWWD